MISSPALTPANPVPISGTAVSAAINTQGQARGSVGMLSDHAGTLSVQRYVDGAGVVPLGAALSIALVAATPNAVGWSDGLPCGSIVISFINSAGAVANLSNITLNLAP
jgi:hypothetical protein